VRRLIAEADVPATFAVCITSAQPVAPWPAPDVTLPGAAVHTMSPGRGDGANIALKDAQVLVRALRRVAAGTASLASATGGYQAEMLQYGFQARLVGKADREPLRLGRRRLMLSPTVSKGAGRRLMGSLTDELQRREAAARAEAEELRGQIVRLTERLARAEERLSRLVIVRETVDNGINRSAAYRRIHPSISSVGINRTKRSRKWSESIGRCREWSQPIRR
jgi:2-polyprenyl-6-methoxyphenol hydroxylase-like FAD-dependent oxidoreductase